ncbi:uncharacterized protein BO66DRAFT_409968 [Aspergillus aculeatinus CBS 121060]|uniref:Uncharacterized protein n=1 Tax=Aspergillus aculeatinus CBS 121060 TaxID=1448322 RepID=A0ACD1HEQ4_9EURO|nr:hypothetical protein BO66DRAFT_409968 [Aspergillus aculeatinus CBS 121060]RAH71861.1 hypothetical protein BO66DRAFT_409968 [Aspergillus aculeatinus CBS 121060]
MLPCGEEEQDRLDLFHKLFTVARVSASLIYAPHLRNGRFFDHLYNLPITPMNCQFYAPFNFESPWPLGEDFWDLLPAVSWVEIDFGSRCANCSLDGLALGQWYQYLKQATQGTMWPIAHNSRDTIRAREEAGFTQIDHRMMKLPLNPRHNDKHETKAARWYSLAFPESLETLSLAPFSRVLKWPLDRIRHLAAEANSEAFNKELHAYNILPSRTKRAFPWEQCVAG